MGRASKWAFEGAVGLVLYAALKWLWLVVWKLLENGLVGWADDRIADALGIQSPSWAPAINFVWLWGVPLILVAATLLLYHRWNNRWGRAATKTSANEGAIEDEKRRRIELIRDARQFAIEACRESGNNTDFRAAAEQYPPYFELRPHLSETFQKKMRASNTIFVNRDGSSLPALATWFLEELDRLEKEWHLR